MNYLFFAISALFLYTPQLGAMELTDDEQELLEQVAPILTETCSSISSMLNASANLKETANFFQKRPPEYTTDKMIQFYQATDNQQVLVEKIRQQAQTSWITKIYITHGIREFTIGTCISSLFITFWAAHRFGKLSLPSILSCTENNIALAFGAFFTGVYSGYRKNERLLDEGLESSKKIKEILEKDPRIIHWLASQQPSANPMPQPENPD